MIWFERIMEYGFIHFPTELLICETVFLIKKQRKENFAFRAAGSLLFYYLLAYIWMFCNSQLPLTETAAVILLYMGYAALTFIPISVCFELNFLESLFVIAGGYAAQHICFALLRIILYIGRGTLDVAGFARLFTQYIIYIIFAVMLYVVFVRKNQDKDTFRAEDVRIAVFAILLILAAVVLSVVYSYDRELNIYNCVICPIYGILCCIMVLILEFYVLRENRLKKEQEMMEQMLQVANGQQKSAREAIDIINIKCHDLKHQIKALAKMEDAGERYEYLREIQQAVSIYDATYHTGCRALDYVLREKSLIFNEYSIDFSCMAEGGAIAFMSAPDIYALMGNALDNALECVLREKEEERIISLKICRNDDMILLHLENRCSRHPEFRDGLPVTDKKDKTQHGFGVRSIRYITEKYGGELYMQIKYGKFYLDILFPASE